MPVNFKLCAIAREREREKVRERASAVMHFHQCAETRQGLNSIAIRKLF